MTEPVRWGFLGAGNIARTALGPAVAAADGATLHAVAARDPDRAAALGPTAVHASYGDLLADPDVEAVYVALANDAHAPLSIAALEAGKHVLCEKPLAMTVGEVDRMAAAAHVNDRLLVEASWYRWHPRVRLAQRLLADDAIGAVRHVAAGFTFPGVPAGNYRLDPAKGGGALYDVGCYAVSAALWAFGGREVVDVAARGRLADTGVDDVADLLLSFDGGDAEVHVSIAEPERQWLVIRGDGGEIELHDAPFTAWREQDTELWLSTGRATERIPVPATDAYRVMVEHVSSAVRGGEAWLLDPAESRRTAEVIDIALAQLRG